MKGLDNNKDQSYFLHLLGQTELSKSLFPVGELDKSEVRAKATEAGFSNHEKKDSTGICFIGERRFRDFLSKYLPATPGPIKTLGDEIIGEHQGAMYYTNGQRQGLGIGGIADADEQPWYVVDKDVKENTLFVTQGANHPALFKPGLRCGSIHWINQPPPDKPYQCNAKIRYRQQDQNCTITDWSENSAGVNFIEPQRAITTGQSCVFYQGEICLGGAIIESIE